jgi:hypothetical protein
VIVGFTWSVLLGRAAGLSNIMVWLGLMDEARAYQPGFLAVLLGLCYIAFPYCVLTLYPSLSRLDREVTEAAQTLGASPWRTFWTVVVRSRGRHRPAVGVRVHARQLFDLGDPRPPSTDLSVASDQARSTRRCSRSDCRFLTVLSLAIVGIVILIESRTGDRLMRAVKWGLTTIVLFFCSPLVVVGRRSTRTDMDFRRRLLARCAGLLDDIGWRSAIERASPLRRQMLPRRCRRHPFAYVPVPTGSASPSVRGRPPAVHARR